MKIKCLNCEQRNLVTDKPLDFCRHCGARLIPYKLNGEINYDKLTEMPAFKTALIKAMSDHFLKTFTKENIAAVIVEFCKPENDSD